MTSYAVLLDRIITDGIAAARRDYCRPDQEHKLAGSVAGFEACRGKSPTELAQLLHEADVTTDQKRHEGAEVQAYWTARCFALEVGWVCNVISAVLVVHGSQPIVAPTCHGLAKAAEILGVRSAA